MARVTLKLKVTTPRVYLRRVELAVYEALDTAVENTVEYGKSVAKRLAPVRKVTGDSTKPKVRNLSASEINDLPAQVRKGLNPVTGRSLRTGKLPRTTTRRGSASLFRPGTRAFRFGEAARDVEFDRVTGAPRLRDAEFEKSLTSRGSYEFRSGRALHTESSLLIDRKGRVRKVSRTTLGGRLRSEIRTRLVSLADATGKAELRLESPTEYAGYVEFPTSRTAAQPYMRPAREAMKLRLRSNVVNELQRIGGRVL